LEGAAFHITEITGTRPVMTWEDRSRANARTRPLIKTEQVSHAPGGLRENGLCAMVRLFLKAGTFPYAEPGSTL
jgi:hypothetical protein